MHPGDQHELQGQHEDEAAGDDGGTDRRGPRPAMRRCDGRPRSGQREQHQLCRTLESRQHARSGQLHAAAAEAERQGRGHAIDDAVDRQLRIGTDAGGKQGLRP